MKVIFYRTLLTRAKNLTPNEKILYSFLVYKSLCQTDWAFKDGKLDKEALSFYFRNLGHWVPMCNTSKTKMARNLCITNNPVSTSFSKFEKYGYVKFDGSYWWVFVNWELLSNG